MAVVKGKEIFNIIEGVGQDNSYRGRRRQWLEMTRITVTEITEIETLMVKEVLTGVENGIIITEVKDTAIVEEEEDGIPTSNITIQGINRNPSFLIQIITVPHQRDINTGTKSRMINTHTPRNHNNTSHKGQTPSQQATNICQLCHSQGHYDYQCQFAGDFMARTQKAFNQGRSYSHQDPNHGDWSQGKNDNNDPNGQPFQ